MDLKAAFNKAIEIEEKGKKIYLETAEKAQKVYAYFNNHYHGYAPENCLYLIERLGLLSEEQERAKAKTSTKQSDLGSFFK